MIKSLDYLQLQEWIQAQKDFVLIDVREPFEHEQRNIGGANIPLASLVAARLSLPADKDIVLYCQKGIRSVIGLQKLEALGYTRLYNLHGGVQYIPLENPSRS